jgi:hypothetical protein
MDLDSEFPLLLQQIRRLRADEEFEFNITDDPTASINQSYF